MSKLAFPSPRARAARLVDQRQIRRQLLSVAGLTGRPVELGDGREVARLADVVVCWTGANVALLAAVVAVQQILGGCRVPGAACVSERRGRRPRRPPPSRSRWGH